VDKYQLEQTTKCWILWNKAAHLMISHNSVWYCDYLRKEAFVTFYRIVWSYVCGDDEVFRIHWQLDIRSIWWHFDISTHIQSHRQSRFCYDKINSSSNEYTSTTAHYKQITTRVKKVAPPKKKNFWNIFTYGGPLWTKIFTCQNYITWTSGIPSILTVELSLLRNSQTFSETNWLHPYDIIS